MELAENRLFNLKKDYLSRSFILSGIDSSAMRNNQQIISAIRSAVSKLAGIEDDVFAIHLSGSRIKGYHTDSSDVDIISVTPSGSWNLPTLSTAIEDEFQRKGIQNTLDCKVGRLISPKVDSCEQLWQMVDSNEYNIAGLYGYTIYENPNLSLAKLAVLEAIDVLDVQGYKWHIVQQMYAYLHLGLKSHFLEKVGDKLGIPPKRVGEVFTDAVFHDHNYRFKLPDIETQMRQLKRWFRARDKSARIYKMDLVYSEVLDYINYSGVRFKNKRT